MRVASIRRCIKYDKKEQNIFMGGWSGWMTLAWHGKLWSWRDEKGREGNTILGEREGGEGWTGGERGGGHIPSLSSSPSPSIHSHPFTPHPPTSFVPRFAALQCQISILCAKMFSGPLMVVGGGGGRGVISKWIGETAHFFWNDFWSDHLKRKRGSKSKWLSLLCDNRSNLLW